LRQLSLQKENQMLPSPRTIKYFEALTREGDKFNHEAWLKRVRQEEAAESDEAKQVAETPSAPTGEGSVKEQVPRLIARSQTRTGPALSRIAAKSVQSSEDVSLKEQLSKVGDVWDKVCEDRSRESIYPYLRAIYSLVARCKREGKSGELRRHAAKIAHLPENENAELFSAVIRSTCDDELDPKTVSKYSRALRYAASRERPPRMLVDFIKGLGGINATSDRYAKRLAGC
jgi:hypothetical protein